VNASNISKPVDALPLVAVVGRANVGKSTLFNRLLRQGRSLVEDTSGVTRDRVAASAWIEGHDVLLVDTGGLDPEAEAGIPAAIRAQVGEVLESAAVILLVVDARDGPLPLDREIAHLLRQAKSQVIVVANKADGPLQDASSAEFHVLGFPEVLPVSAEHRRGFADLEIAIAERLPEPSSSSRQADPSPQLAIVGRPNVGKSSLLNRLLGKDRNIVAAEPGTTRDSTDSRLRHRDQEIVLIDTAGIRRLGKRREHLERGSALMAVRSIEKADLVLLVLDASVGVTDQDCKIARLALDRGRGLILVLNKWDLVEGQRGEREVQRQLERRLGFVPDPVVLRTSAKTGLRVRQLIPRALELMRQLRVEIPTAEVNRALEEAIERYAPPLKGRRQARFFYATQTSTRPLTLVVFVNNPDLIPANYRKYIESFFRKRFDVKSAPVRVRFRARREAEPRR
jgi:GTP-binding protein